MPSGTSGVSRPAAIVFDIFWNAVRVRPARSAARIGRAAETVTQAVVLPDAARRVRLRGRGNVQELSRGCGGRAPGAARRKRRDIRSETD